MSSLTRTIRNGVDTDKLFATLDLIEAARAADRSAVYDMIAHGVPIVVDVTSG
jgi:hypothetical protein